MIGESMKDMPEFHCKDFIDSLSMPWKPERLKGLKKQAYSLYSLVKDNLLDILKPACHSKYWSNFCDEKYNTFRKNKVFTGVLATLVSKTVTDKKTGML